MSQWSEAIKQESKSIDNIMNSLLRCNYCSKMLLNHINDLLDFAKFEKNKFLLSYEFFDLTQTIRNAIDDVEYMAQGKKITPRFMIDPNIELFFKNIYGDEGRYTQIFLNFLSNAFKFTPDNGKISIEIKPYGT
jgi:signal transduction histidine kinase